MRRFGLTAFVSGLALPLLLLSVGLNAMQTMKILDLVDPDSSAHSNLGRSPARLTGASLDGQPQTITFTSDRPTVLYFFSPTCGWCERNWPNIEAIARRSEGRYRLVAVTQATGLKAFAEARGLSLEILEGVSADATRGLELGGTPHTLVVSSAGRITHEWIGVFDGRVKQSLEDFFEIELPGLRPAPAKGSPRP
jgi:thiol-disulfide isomerase/thioredoxin